MDAVKLLRELSSQFGVSGFEEEIRDWIYQHIQGKEVFSEETTPTPAMTHGTVTEGLPNA